MIARISPLINEWRFKAALAASKRAEADALRRGNTQAVGAIRKARKAAVLADLAGAK